MGTRWTTERKRKFKASMAAKRKARLTVRQKSTEQSAAKVKNIYHIKLRVSLKAETLSQAHVYAGRMGEAIEGLGATVAVEGEVVEIESELNKEYNFLSVCETSAPTRN